MSMKPRPLSVNTRRRNRYGSELREIQAADPHTSSNFIHHASIYLQLWSSSIGTGGSTFTHRMILIELEDLGYPYLYCPSFSRAIVFAAVFGLSTILNLIQAIHYRKSFCWVIIMAGVWKTTSYVLRALSRYDISPKGLGFASQFLV
ncbi:hypothetical protein PM082_016680 [Marasmius tenuissimus]|nr:hypothetical protein PM082_016680 [Marasmius tenuissimus]